MKTDLAVFEIKQLLKKFDKQNKIKTVILLCAGVALITVAAILLVAKFKKKSEPISYDGLDFEDWDDLDDMDYEDYYDDADYDESEEAESEEEQE